MGIISHACYLKELMYPYIEEKSVLKYSLTCLAHSESSRDSLANS